MRVLVIGAGSIGMRHAGNLQAMSHQVVLMDNSEEALKKAGNKITTYNLMPPERSVDCAVICTPASTHAALLEQCLDLNLPVYVEKPLGHYSDLSQLVKSNQRYPRPLVQVGYQLRFHEQIMKAWSMRDSVTSGYLKCYCNMDSWQGESSKGDFLLEMSHEIDIAVLFGAGKIQSFSVDQKTKTAILRFANWTVEVCGSFEKYDRHWIVYSGKNKLMECRFSSGEELGNQMYVNAMNAFLKAIKYPEARSFACTIGQALKVMEIVKEVQE